MTLKTYALLSTIFLSLIAFIHLFRILCQWDVMIDDWSAPMWVSYAIVPPAGLLSFAGFRLMRRIGKYWECPMICTGLPNSGLRPAHIAASENGSNDRSFLWKNRGGF